MLRRAALLASALLAAPGAGADAGPDADAGSERRPWFQDTVEVRGGAVFTFIDSDLDVPPDFDLEDDFDLDEFVVEPSGHAGQILVPAAFLPS